MTTNVTPSVIKIDREDLKKLVSEVKETLATDVDIQRTTAIQKKFNIADLWNCQKALRTAASRKRQYLNF